MTSQHSVAINPAPTGAEADARAAHDAAMAAKADGVSIVTTTVDDAGNRNTQTIQKPADLILGKFKTHDDLAKAYTELERKLGAGQPPAAEPQKTAEPQKAPTTQEPPKGDTPAQQSAIDLAAAEFATDGKLSDETFAALEKTGIPRPIAEQYLSGIKAQAEMVEQSAYSVVGGEQQYTALVEWAAQNLTDAEIDAYDEAVNSANPAKIKSAVEGLNARYRLAAGFEPGVKFGGKSAGPGEFFKSRHEMQAAMSDPRYKAGDPAFHAEVREKIANAERMGVNIFA